MSLRGFKALLEIFFYSDYMMAHIKGVPMDKTNDTTCVVCNRRATDKPVSERIIYILKCSDISFTIFICGFILPIWTILAIFETITLTDFLNNPLLFFKAYYDFEYKFYLHNHFIVGFVLMWLAVKRLPNPITSLVSAWMIVIWITVFALPAATFTDKAFSVVYIFLAFIMLQRSKNYVDRRRN